MLEVAYVTKTSKSLCFVAGPIGKDGSGERKHSDLLLHAVIKHVLQHDRFGYHVKRADEDSDPGMISDRIVSDVIHADLVVADLTDLNPNVFYELGIRHSTEKPTIHIAKSGTTLPFDNINHRTIFVDLTDWHSIEQARERLSSFAEAIKLPGYRVSNPITQANASFEMRQSTDPRDRMIAAMSDKISSLETVFSKANVIFDGDPSSIFFRAFVECLKANQMENAARIYCMLTGADFDTGTKFVVAVVNPEERIEALRLHRMATREGLREARNFYELVQSRLES